MYNIKSVKHGSIQKCLFVSGEYTYTLNFDFLLYSVPERDIYIYISPTENQTEAYSKFHIATIFQS